MYVYEWVGIYLWKGNVSILSYCYIEVYMSCFLDNCFLKYVKVYFLFF